MQSFAEADLTGLRTWPASPGSVPARWPMPPGFAAAIALFVADLGAAFLATILIVHVVPISGRIGSGPATPGSGMLGRYAVASIPALLLLSGHYGQRLPFPGELRQVCAVALLAFLLAGCSAAFLDAAGAIRASAGSWLLFPPAAIALRTVARNALDRCGAWRLPVLLVESADSGASVAEQLRREPLPGYRIGSVLRPDLVERIAESGQWRQLLDAHGAARIAVVTGSDRARDHRILDSIIRDRAPFFVMSRPGSLPVVGWRATPFLSHDTVVLSYRGGRGDRLSRVAKRLLDVIGASLLLAVAAPLMASLALLIRADGGPAIFRHERVGANGVRFRCLKFRTMATDAADALRRALDSDAALAAEWAATQKLRCDPRVTPVGRVLRRTSLDELPQLFNVLRGEMSLVGPRPIVADEIPRYAADIAFYYGGRPGLTGLWQVSGRSETSFQQRVRLDRSYVRNWTLAHDVSILLRTVSVVLSRRGAH